MTHQPAISFSNSFHFPFNRACGRTSNVAKKMTRITAVTLSALLSLSACKKGEAPVMPAHESSSSAIAGSNSILVTRNFPSPPSKAMTRMPPDMHLGRDAYAVNAPNRWQEILHHLHPGTPKNTLPVLFAATFEFDDGESQLAVGQLQCSFKGDGIVTPGPTFTCNLFTIDVTNPAMPVLLWEGQAALGTLQGSRIIRMTSRKESPAEVSLIHEEIHGQKQVVSTNLVFKPASGHSIVMERRPAAEGAPKGEQGADGKMPEAPQPPH